MSSVRDFNCAIGMLYSLKEILIVSFLLYCNSKKLPLYILYIWLKKYYQFLAWLSHLFKNHKTFFVSKIFQGGLKCKKKE